MAAFKAILRPTAIHSLPILGLLAIGISSSLAEPPKTTANEEALLAYLTWEPPHHVTSVAVGIDEISIQGILANPQANLLLAEVPMHFLLDDPHRFASLHPITPTADGTFSVSVSRFHEAGERTHDRLTSRWQLVEMTNDFATAVSHARHADTIACRQSDMAELELSSKKGLGGWRMDRIPTGLAELDELGITAVTVNIVLQSIFSPTEKPESTPFTWQGHTYYANDRRLREFDENFRAAQDKGVMVSAILLIQNPARNDGHDLLAHPGATAEGRYAMPDVTSQEGFTFYAAILDFMAERWSHPDGPHGRVHHWIMHNEVDAGYEWTNAGDIPAVVYLDLYHRSLRLMDLIARQYDPNARAFISLTHHWTDAGNPKWYGSRQLLELLAAFCRAEGDFPWAPALHPYPQNLTNPRTWEDDQATFSFDTPKITPRNLEVLNAWMNRSEMLSNGKPRPVHLSENGFNSTDYSDTALAAQAAGMAFAWQKIQKLDNIKLWHYHNWIDNRGEFGLLIGLRKFPEDEADPLGPKPIWHLYKALATPNETQASTPYLDLIGIRSWDEIHHHDPID